MTQLGKFEKYLIEEFFDDYRAGAMTLVGCTPEEVPRSTDPMPAPTSSSPAPGTSPAGSVPGAKSPLSVPEGASGLTTATVRFPARGTDISGYLARPGNGAVGPAVLICHENRGLTPHIQDVARRYAKAGYAALALDLLSREDGTAGMDPDAVPGALTQAGAQRHVSDFAAAFDYLNAQDFVDEGRIAMNGFCFGGGITWQAATAIPGLKATWAFYGPSPDLDKVPAIMAAVFGVYAELDQRITRAMPALRDALAKTAVPYELKVYPGVDHAFHNDIGERYNQEQATAAWNDTLAWFAKYV
ncbi:dienelactone hydrolase family protein [Arthrobacter sp. I3]|uniref:dienelactone hydrolase family protein n=1 Tax=Arthrobacter sp. I3 TaxID=218158 RepID=UPI000485602D|nr:dienelactone hydrolase family protein [Arthrobacter sp. I3]